MDPITRVQRLTFGLKQKQNTNKNTSNGSPQKPQKGFQYYLKKANKDTQ